MQGTHIPIPTKGNVAGAAADVDAHPAGASIFGAEDMVGNVWQVRVLTYLLTKFLARNPYLLTIYRNPYLLTYLRTYLRQWTDEYTDARTRSGILRGGSFYQLPRRLETGTSVS